MYRRERPEQKLDSLRRGLQLLRPSRIFRDNPCLQLQRRPRTLQTTRHSNSQASGCKSTQTLKVNRSLNEPESPGSRDLQNERCIRAVLVQLRLTSNPETEYPGKQILPHARPPEWAL